MKERKDQNEKIKELTEKLQAGIQELHDSEKYRDYLRTTAKFHHYSLNNSLLIWAQRPDATAVAGYRAWQTKFGRTVNPGAKGIMIYEPASYKRTLREVVTDADGNPLYDEDGNKIAFKLPASVDVDGIYPYTRMYKEVEENGIPMKCYIVFKRSSDMDTKEMAHLIDGAIQVAQELNIDTDTPDRQGWWESLKGER